MAHLCRYFWPMKTAIQMNMMTSWHRNFFPHHWSFVRGSHQSLGVPLRRGKWFGALMFPLMLIWTKCWTNSEHVYSSVSPVSLSVCPMAYLPADWNSSVCFASDNYFQVGLTVVAYVLLVSEWNSLHNMLWSILCWISENILNEYTWKFCTNETLWLYSHRINISNVPCT